MTGTARSHVYRAVFGKQSAESTANTTNNTLWEVSLGDGSFVRSDQVREALPYTDTDDMPVGYWTQTASASGSIICPSDPWTAALLWKIHLGGSAIAGSNPYTHTMTKADAPIFGTWFFMRPDVVGGTNRWERMDDGFTQSLNMHGEAGKEIRLTSTLMGKKDTFNVTAPAPTSGLPASGAAGDYRIPFITKGKMHTMNGSTLDVDLDATPSTTQIRNIQSFDITSEWSNFAWLQTDQLNPSYYSKGLYSASFSATVLFDSFASYAATFFGTKTVASDMAQSSTVVQGSLDFTFPVADGTASRTTQIKLTSQVIEVEPAVVNTSSEGIAVTLSGKVVKPAASVEAISVITLNDRSTTP